MRGRNLQPWLNLLVKSS